MDIEVLLLSLKSLRMIFDLAKKIQNENCFVGWKRGIQKFFPLSFVRLRCLIGYLGRRFTYSLNGRGIVNTIFDLFILNMNKIIESWLGEGFIIASKGILKYSPFWSELKTQGDFFFVCFTHINLFSSLSDFPISDFFLFLWNLTR